MTGKFGVLAVSGLAIMAAVPVWAGPVGQIASAGYVKAQIDPVKTQIDSHVENNNVHITNDERASWNAKQDASNRVTVTDAENIFPDQINSTTLYPSMATTNAMIIANSGNVAASIVTKQPKSTEDYQMGASGGKWTTMTDAQKGALDSGATAELINKIAPNETAIATINASAPMNSGINAERVATYDAMVSGKQDKLTETNKLPVNLIATGADNRFVTDADIATWTTKQDALGYVAENAANRVTATKSEDITDAQSESTTMYPSMATVSALVNKNTGELTATVGMKQNRSDSNVSNVGLRTGSHLTPGYKVANNLKALDTAIGANETSINTINNSDVMNSGINATKVTQIQTNKDDIAAINNPNTGILKQAKNYTDNTATTINNTIGTVDDGKTVVQMIKDVEQTAASDNSALAARVTTNENNITTINNSDVMNSGINATKVTQIQTNKDDIAAINNPNTGILKQAKNYTDNTATTINNTIGTVDDGKTVVQMIKDVEQTAASDNSALAARVTTNENNITALTTNKQDKLTSTNLKTNGNGVVKSVVANNGNVTVSRGAVVAGEIAADAVETAKIKDENVTKAKLEKSVQTSLGLADSALQQTDITTGAANGNIAVNGSDVAVKGLKSAAYETKETFVTVPSASGTSGKSVLTYDSDTQTYYWEQIGR